MKDFKTIDQLVRLLESRGVITDEWTPLAIERESYYAIVNGYKEPFLDKKAMASTHEDVYLPGTRFEWIYCLFMFDRELRALNVVNGVYAIVAAIIGGVIGYWIGFLQSPPA